jgi:transcription antitermination factor NusG
MNSWLILQTRPRWEKKASDLLFQKGLEAFCPLLLVKRKWSDRIKLIRQPLFPLYVFVKVSEEGRTTVRLTPGAVNFVVKDRKPVIIKEKTIEAIKQFQEKYPYLEVRTTIDERTVPPYQSRKLYVDGLDVYLIGWLQPQLIAESTDKKQ